ncbi:5139_t:CDS:2 [Scutellospora calospora]|uniref:5139_t:CDS:1 n=1 Tax=Scutellospora calospora TaxID=85575 RepID=A0ACA9KEL2_9GLOM|nr:5139_t:CDS:2 [Scutellospora calospora]
MRKDLDKWIVEQGRTETTHQLTRNEKRSSLTGDQLSSRSNLRNVPQKENQVEGSTYAEPQNIPKDTQQVEPIQSGSVREQAQHSITNLVSSSNRYDNRLTSSPTDKEPLTPRPDIRHHTSTENKVSNSLDYIVSLGDNDHVLLITLTKKTAFLYALSSACHPSDLAQLDLTTIRFIQNGITIECINLKEVNIAIGYRINKKCTKKIFIGKYQESTELYPATTLQHYMTRTEELQHSEDQKTVLFLSNVGFHKPAVVDTIAN